jgi:NB-ARC domain
VDAVEHVLRAFGVSGRQMPAHAGDQAALLRTTLAGRRVLMLLDNAYDEAQVLPLLPGTPGCLVLVTSRPVLALDDAHPVPLDVLPLPDAVTLFTRAVGERAEPAPAHLVTELVELCGQLPLAILIAAARLRSRPGWAMASLLQRLRNPRHRLAELSAGGENVAAALDLSYRDLTDEHRRVYQLLGRHPGQAVTISAAALAEVGVADAHSLLDGLLQRHLLHESAPGVFRLHDLVRAHAAKTAESSWAAETIRAASAGSDRGAW